MIDFEKAFDSLEWDFLFKTLDKMNFGVSFIKWVKLFYTNIESCIANNGTSSNYFKINRGVRQGDPLSAYLFILSVEVMAQAILKDDTIHGIKVNDNEIKLTQYADDTTAILKDQDSVLNFLKQIHNLEKISGLKINKSKTEAIWLGNHPPPFRLPDKMQWTTKPIKVLGIYIGWNLNDAYMLNFSEKISKVKRLLQSWLQRKLSLTGKVLIIKSLAISQIIHLANLLPFPDEIIKEFDKMFYDFIWNGKTHKVKKMILIQDYHNGGHKMTDLRTMIKTQKLKWIKFYLNNHKCLWRNTMEHFIKVHNLNLLLRSNYDIKDFQITSDFYKEVLSILYSLNNENLNFSKGNLFNQYLFYNKNIKIGGRALYNKELFDAGIWHVKDLFDKNNKIIPFAEWNRRGISNSKYMYWCSMVTLIQKTNKRHNVPDEGHFNDLTIKYKNIERLDLLNCDTKTVYCTLIKHNIVYSKASAKYSKLYNILNDEDWKNIYLIPRCCTSDNKIKEFQYKILHRYLPTNDLLYKMERIPSNKCGFCEMYKENLNHLFFDCIVVKHIWINIEQCIERTEKCIVRFKNSDVILGFNFKLKKCIVDSYGNVNKIILFVKYYIWQCRCLSLDPSYANLKIWLIKHIVYEPFFTRFCAEM